jgi:hypothetical protein
MSTTSCLPIDGSTVKLKGLPFKASADDILRFFSGFTLSCSSVYLSRHPDGRPNGEVRVLSLVHENLLCLLRTSGRNFCDILSL